MLEQGVSSHEVTQLSALLHDLIQLGVMSHVHPLGPLFYEVGHILSVFLRLSSSIALVRVRVFHAVHVFCNGGHHAQRHHFTDWIPCQLVFQNCDLLIQILKAAYDVPRVTHSR